MVMARIFLTYFTPEGEVGVTEEANGDDGPTEELRRINVRDNTAARQVVVHHGRVDPAGPDDPRLLQGLDHQVLDPVRDGVHLSFRVELLIASSPLLELTAVSVPLTKEIFGPQRGLVNREPLVLPPPRLLHDVVDVPLDDGGLCLVKELPGVDAVQHLPPDGVPLTHGDAGGRCQSAEQRIFVVILIISNIPCLAPPHHIILLTQIFGLVRATATSYHLILRHLYNYSSVQCQ